MTDNDREEFTKPERVQVTRRPREHYKSLYFTARGRLWIACAVIACLLGYIIFKGAIK